MPIQSPNNKDNNCASSSSSISSSSSSSSSSGPNEWNQDREDLASITSLSRQNINPDGVNLREKAALHAFFCRSRFLDKEKKEIIEAQDPFIAELADLANKPYPKTDSFNNEEKEEEGEWYDESDDEGSDFDFEGIDQNGESTYFGPEEEVPFGFAEDDAQSIEGEEEEGEKNPVFGFGEVEEDIGDEVHQEQDPIAFTGEACKHLTFSNTHYV